MEMCEGPNWGVLPEEMKELILSKVPLVDLAYASATSKIFQAAFLRELAREQKAYIDSAVELLGQERLATLVMLIGRVLKGEDMKAYVDHWWGCTLARSRICRDGTCHKESPSFQAPASPITHIVDTQVRFWLSSESAPHGMGMYVQVHNGSSVSLRIFPWSKAVGGLEKCSFIRSSGIEGVAIVQALLSKGLAELFHGAGHQVRVDVRGGRCSELTQAMVAPLMPFITPREYERWELTGVLKLPRST